MAERDGWLASVLGKLKDFSPLLPILLFYPGHPLRSPRPILKQRSLLTGLTVLAVQSIKLPYTTIICRQHTFTFRICHVEMKHLHRVFSPHFSWDHSTFPEQWLDFLQKQIPGCPQVANECFSHLARVGCTNQSCTENPRRKVKRGI